MKRLLLAILSLVAVGTMLSGCVVYPAPLDGTVLINGGHMDNGRHGGYGRHRHGDDD